MSPKCKNCGSHVSAEFARCASDNDGEVHACLSCTDKGTVALEAAGLDAEDVRRGAGGSWLSGGY